MPLRLLRIFAPLLSFLGLTATAAAPACSAAASGAAAARAPATVPASQRPDDAGLRGPFLWEVQGKSGPSYLFGTIHAGYQADKELPAWVWQKLSSCDTFVMETDLSKVDQTEVAKMTVLPEGESLDQMLGQKDFDALVDLVGLPAPALRRLQPWAVYTVLFQRLYPTPEPLDEALRTRALAQGKHMAFLEDWKFQLDALSQSIDLDDLREVIAPDGKARRQMAAMIAAYRAGDFEKLSAIALDPEEMARHPRRHARLFDDRNRAWIAQLAPRLDRGGAFIAVGAGHFAGEHGLIELLRARGYILTRVVEP